MSDAVTLNLIQNLNIGHADVQTGNLLKKCINVFKTVYVYLNLFNTIVFF